MSHCAKTFTLLYFALFQEKKGVAEETRNLTDGLSAKLLFEQVCRELSLEIEMTSVRVSINHTFADWEQTLATGDIVAFIPPVAGG